MKRLFVILVAVASFVVSGTALAAPVKPAICDRFPTHSACARFQAVAAAPQATLTRQGEDIVFTVIGLTPFDMYKASFIVDGSSCIGHGIIGVRSDGTIRFYTDTFMADFVTHPAGWSHITAKLQAPDSPTCTGDAILTADLDNLL